MRGRVRRGTASGPSRPGPAPPLALPGPRAVCEDVQPLQPRQRVLAAWAKPVATITLIFCWNRWFFRCD